MRYDQLTHIDIITDNIAGMCVGLHRARHADNWDSAVQICVDMHMNVYGLVSVLGLTRDDFLYRVNLRRANLGEKILNYNDIVGGLILPTYQGEPDDKP